MTKITAPAGWSRNIQTELYTASEEEYYSLPEYYRTIFDDKTIDMGLSPRVLLKREWDDIQFNMWADSQSFEHLA